MDALLRFIEVFDSVVVMFQTHHVRRDV
jgi:hypothetical protein